MPARRGAARALRQRDTCRAIINSNGLVQKKPSKAGLRLFVFACDKNKKLFPESQGKKYGVAVLERTLPPRHTMPRQENLTRVDKPPAVGQGRPDYIFTAPPAPQKAKRLLTHLPASRVHPRADTRHVVRSADRPFRRCQSKGAG